MSDTLESISEQWKSYKKAVLNPQTYELGPGGTSITCMKCQRTSHNPSDVQHRYCGHCHVYHDSLPKPHVPEWIIVQIRRAFFAGYVSGLKDIEKASLELSDAEFDEFLHRRSTEAMSFCMAVMEGGA